MTWTEYERTTEKQMRGMRFRIVCPIRNGNILVPAGAEVTVEHKYKGLTICGPACQHCGVSIYMSRVSPLNLDIVKE